MRVFFSFFRLRCSNYQDNAVYFPTRKSVIHGRILHAEKSEFLIWFCWVNVGMAQEVLRVARFSMNISDVTRHEFSPKPPPLSKSHSAAEHYGLAVCVTYRFVTRRAWTVYLYRRPFYSTSKVIITKSSVCGCLYRLSSQTHSVLNHFSNIPFFTSQITLFGTSCERPFTGDSDDCRSSHGVYLTTLQVKFGKQNTVQPSPIPKRLEVARTHFPFTASDRACTRASFWRHRPSWILSNQSREEGVGASDLEAA